MDPLFFLTIRVVGVVVALIVVASYVSESWPWHFDISIDGCLVLTPVGGFNLLLGGMDICEQTVDNWRIEVYVRRRNTWRCGKDNREPIFDCVVNHTLRSGRYL